MLLYRVLVVVSVFAREAIRVKNNALTRVVTVSFPCPMFAFLVITSNLPSHGERSYMNKTTDRFKLIKIIVILWTILRKFSATLWSQNNFRTANIPQTWNVLQIQASIAVVHPVAESWHAVVGIVPPNVTIVNSKMRPIPTETNMPGLRIIPIHVRKLFSANISASCLALKSTGAQRNATGHVASNVLMHGAEKLVLILVPLAKSLVNGEFQ